MAGRSNLQAIRGCRRLLPGIAAQVSATRQAAQFRHPHKAILRYQRGSRDYPRIPQAMRGLDRPTANDRPAGLAGSQPRTVDHRNPGASGSVNRSFSPESVRYMSVTSVVQRRHLTQ